MVNGFELISSKEPKIMILGSAPSVMSLNLYQYYGNKRNCFWTLLAKLYNKESFENYNQKISFIENNNLLLWDVVKVCNREGSLDSNINQVVANDIEKVIKDNTSLNLVIFNGKKANELYKKYIYYYPKNIDFFTLPSTSPAYTLSFEKKYEKWKSIFDKYI